jgi:F-type H+-transporting ATPase subunit epsilon
MRLTITAPTAIVVDSDGVVAVRAEDESGSFGILPGHTLFMTALTPSVVGWRDRAGKERFCAVRGGVLSVTAGGDVTLATREAVVGDDLERLEGEVLRRFKTEAAAEEEARIGEARLQLALVRRMLTYLRPERDRRAAAGPRAPLSNLE